LILMDRQDIIYSPDRRGGANTAVLKVCAEFCLRCKERLYSEEIRADQGQAGAPGNRGVSGFRSLIPVGVVSENDSSNAVALAVPAQITQGETTFSPSAGWKWPYP
jgi:hypothetical protein